MNKIELPFDNKPLVCQYLLSAYSMGIIQANAKKLNKEIMPWICSRYVNCSFDNNQPPEINSKFSVQVFDGNATNDNVLVCTRVAIPIEEVIESEGKHFIGLLVDLISSGNYIVGMFNEKNIPIMSSYQKKDAPHTFLLFGIDHETSHFSSAGFVEDLRFSKYSVSFNDFLNSIKSLKDNTPYVLLKTVKYNTEKEYVVNYPRVIQSFSDYLNSENNLRSGCPESEVFGVSAIKALHQFCVESTEDRRADLDIRYSRGLSDAKKITAKGVEFLCNYFKINDPKAISLAREASKRANLIHLLTIKYNISKNRDDLPAIWDCFNQIVDIENAYMKDFLLELKSVKEMPIGTFY